MNAVLERLCGYGIVPVAVLEHAKDAKPLAEALCKGGLPCVEVTFRTEAAEEAIKVMTDQFPEMLVGAGTILTIGQIEKATAAGAAFIVSPGFDPEIVDYCISKKIPVVPGCITPSEVAQGVKRGLQVLKFFPAEQAGGTAMLKALAAPYRTVKFLPTGGINAENLKEYLSFNKVAACGGSWMVKAGLIKSGCFEKITELTKEAVKLVQETRGQTESY